jgi:hypothetical protein
LREEARREVKSVPNLSPVMYSNTISERTSVGVTHSLFAWERRDGTGREVSNERVMQEYKIGESPSDFGEFALERWQGSLFCKHT